MTPFHMEIISSDVLIENFFLLTILTSAHKCLCFIWCDGVKRILQKIFFGTFLFDLDQQAESLLVKSACINKIIKHSVLITLGAGVEFNLVKYSSLILRCFSEIAFSLVVLLSFHEN